MKLKLDFQVKMEDCTQASTFTPVLAENNLLKG